MMVKQLYFSILHCHFLQSSQTQATQTQKAARRHVRVQVVPAKLGLQRTKGMYPSMCRNNIDDSD